MIIRTIDLEPDTIALIAAQLTVGIMRTRETTNPEVAVNIFDELVKELVKPPAVEG